MSSPVFRKIPGILLTVLIFTACDQDEIAPDQKDAFIRFYAAGYLDDRGAVAKERPDGGYVILGTAQNVFGEERHSDLWLVLTDEYGIELDGTPNLVGTEENEEAIDLLVDQDGYVIAGCRGDEEENSLDLYIVKTDLQGNTLWEQVIDLDGNDRVSSIIHAEDAGYIVSGYKSPGNGSYTSGVLLKLDSDGSPLDTITIELTNPSLDQLDVKLNQVLNRDGRVITVGSGAISAGLTLPYGINTSFTAQVGTPNSLSDISGKAVDMVYIGDSTVCTLSAVNQGGPKVLVSLVSYARGDIKPVKGASNVLALGNGSFFPTSICTTLQDGYAITGTRRIGTNEDIFLVLLDSGLNVLVTKYFGQTGDQQGSHIERLEDGSLLICGSNSFEDNGMAALIKTGPGGEI